MFEGILAYIVTAVGLFLISLIAVTNTLGHLRKFVVLLYLGVLPLIYVVTLNLLSHPRPVSMIPKFLLPQVEEAEMLADHMVEDEYIMLLMMYDGIEYPRWWRFPWDQQMAEDIQDAKNRNDAENGGGVFLDMPFDNSLERRDIPFAHPLPQPRRMPEKPNEEPDTLDFDHPSAEDA